MKISVIIPMYNCSKSIISTLDSVYKQTYKDYEIILVDDGSQDNTLHIVNQYAKLKENIKIISTLNFGVSHARNIALQNISEDTDVIAFLDSDDLLEENSFRYIKDYMKDNDMICFAYRQNGKIVSIGELEEKINKKDFYEKLSNKLLFNQIWNKAYKKDLIKDIKFNEDLDLGEDLDFNIRCLIKAKKFCYVNEIYYDYFLYNNGLSLTKRKNIFKTKCTMYENVKKFYNENNYDKSFLYKMYYKAYLQGITYAYDCYAERKKRLKEFNSYAMKNSAFSEEKQKKSIIEFVVWRLLKNDVVILFLLSSIFYFYDKFRKIGKVEK